MLTLLSIIGFIVAVLALSFYLHQYGKERYSYSIFSIGGMAVSFLGSIAFVFAYSYFKQGLIPNLVVAIILGLVPYILMFVRDSKKMTITLAFAAMILRFTISAILILVILWYTYGRKSELDEMKQSLRNIERKLG